MKQAYLIMAHDDIPLLKKLIGLLDYPDNDIYLHLDKKCNEDISDIQKGILHSGFYRIPSMDVKWGGGRGSKLRTQFIKMCNRK